ncbi:MAG TPA: hypothetical protein VF954_00080 [Acidimicrobiales bacterium]
MAAAGLAVLTTIASGPGAWAQTPGPDLPSVAMAPTESHTNDPNKGQWFVFQLQAGQSGRTKASIANPADVAQTVSLSVRDLTFSPEGAPQINDGPTQTDVGAWSTVGTPTVTVPAKGHVLVPFSVAVPTNADPGDHSGVVVATSRPEPTAGGQTLVKRVAVRLYVTVPGDATRAFEVASVRSSPDSALFPRRETVRVRLRNTGRIRLHPTVTVAGRAAVGADTMIAQTYEDYYAQVPVGFAGGPVNEKVVATTDAGPARVVPHSQFVIPWGVIAALLVGGFILLGLAMLVRRRQRKLAALHADLRRLEQLVTQRPGMTQGRGVLDPPPDAPGPADTSGEVRAIETAIKRARRTGHPETLPELAVALRAAGGDALDVLLEALPDCGADRRDELVAAIRAHPEARVGASHRLRALPPDLAARLTAPRRAIRKSASKT